MPAPSVEATSVFSKHVKARTSGLDKPLLELIHVFPLSVVLKTPAGVPQKIVPPSEVKPFELFLDVCRTMGSPFDLFSSSSRCRLKSRHRLHYPQQAIHRD